MNDDDDDDGDGDQDGDDDDDDGDQYPPYVWVVVMTHILHCEHLCSSK